MCYGNFLISFLLKNFVWASLEDENVYNGSIFKENKSLEKIL